MRTLLDRSGARRSSVGGAVLGLGVIALLLEPALSAAQRPEDWYQHMWYAWHQAESIRLNQAPSLFAYNKAGAFDPHYAFYGGTLYAAAGLLTLAVGSVKIAFGLSAVLAVGTAYGGWYWLARMARLTPWVAHLPGVLFITSPYYINIIYRTGAWAELVAVSALPMLVASGTSVVRAERLRLGPALALALSTLFFTGSHNITLLWGTSLLGFALAVTRLAMPRVQDGISRRGLMRAAGVVLPAILINGWFLLPDLAYFSRTFIASTASPAADIRWSAAMTAPEFLFTLGRPASPPRFYVLALPLVSIAWLATGAVIARPGWRTSWYRLAVVLSGFAIALLFLMTSTRALLALPGPFRMLQFGFRLESYILLCLSGVTIALLRLARATGRRPASLWYWTAPAIAALAVVQAVGQAHQHPPLSRVTGDRVGLRPYQTTKQQASQYDYRDARWFGQASSALEDFSDAEQGDRVSVTFQTVPGELLFTNAVVMPPLITITGAEFLGHTMYGLAAFKITDATSPGLAQVTIEAARPWPVVVGRLLSLLGVLGLLANCFVIARHRLRPRRRRHVAAA
jgi:uncharacterized membrane protein